MEELAEADVLWPDRVGSEDRVVDVDGAPTQHLRIRRTASAPITVVPSSEERDDSATASSFSKASSCHVIGFAGGDADGDGEGTFPPHVVIARRFSDNVASSVCTGNGRTLKGRDLFRFRNCVLRMTGYIER